MELLESIVGLNFRDDVFSNPSVLKTFVRIIQNPLSSPVEVKKLVSWFSDNFETILEGKSVKKILKIFQSGKFNLSSVYF